MNDDLAKLQGTWQAIELEMDGEAMPAPMLANARIVIEGDRFVSLGMGADYSGTVRIDATKKPRQMEMHFDSGPEKGNRSLAIYELKGATWRICLTVTAKTRPAKFATAPGSGLALETLKRRKENAPESGKPKKSASGAKAKKIAAGMPQASSEPIAELEGEWAMVSCVIDGTPLNKEAVAFGRRTFRGNDTKMTFGPQTWMQATIAVDPSKTPKEIDYFHAFGENNGKTQAGIYERKGDILRFAHATPGLKRPADFEAGKGKTVAVWRLIGKK